MGKIRVGPLPPSPQNSPVEVKFQLDLSGILRVTATHMSSGKSAEVTIADSPYRLTDSKRRKAAEQVQALRAVEVDQQPTLELVNEADLKLARAMLARADKALSKAEASEEKDAAESSRAALEAAIEAKSADVEERMDALSDALLDLM